MFLPMIRCGRARRVLCILAQGTSSVQSRLLTIKTGALLGGRCGGISIQHEYTSRAVLYAVNSLEGINYLDWRT